MVCIYSKNLHIILYFKICIVLYMYFDKVDTGTIFSFHNFLRIGTIFKALSLIEADHPSPVLNYSCEVFHNLEFK